MRSLLFFPCICVGTEPWPCRVRAVCSSPRLASEPGLKASGPANVLPTVTATANAAYRAAAMRSLSLDDVGGFRSSFSTAAAHPQLPCSPEKTAVRGERLDVLCASPLPVARWGNFCVFKASTHSAGTLCRRVSHSTLCFSKWRRIRRCQGQGRFFGLLLPLVRQWRHACRSTGQE